MTLPAESPSSDPPATDGGGDRDGDDRDGEDERTSSGVVSSEIVPVTRRELLVAGGGAATVSRIGDVAAEPADDGATIRVRLHPGPVPPSVRFQYAPDAIGGNWPEPYRATAGAVEDAMEQFADYAADRTSLADPSVAVERGKPVSVTPTERALSSEIVLPGQETVLEAFRRRLVDRGRGTEDEGEATTHLLLCWAPLNYRIGYGVARGTVGVGDDAPARAVVNVGATERWDGRAVTQNMAIHEVLHTFLTEQAVGSVGGSRCDHDLGEVVRTDDDTLRVSPMATAYAGPDEFGGGTRWHGGGCYDHDAFFRHDGRADPGRFDYEYTTDISDAVLKAATHRTMRW